MDTTGALAALDALEDELRERVARADADLAAVRADRSAATADDEHDPEGSTLSDDVARLTGLRHTALAGLDDVADARARVADGTYGRCAVCGGEIPAGRLEARPTARTCVTCAS